MTRFCYWDPRFIASQPFCNVSLLSDKEARAMAELEEIRLFENLDIIKKDLHQKMLIEAVSELSEAKHNGSAIDVKKVVSAWLAAPKKIYFCGVSPVLDLFSKNGKKAFGYCYTQTSDGRPSNIVINRAEFLRK